MLTPSSRATNDERGLGQLPINELLGRLWLTFFLSLVILCLLDISVIAVRIIGIVSIAQVGPLVLHVLSIATWSSLLFSFVVFSIALLARLIWGAVPERFAKLSAWIFVSIVWTFGAILIVKPWEFEIDPANSSLVLPFVGAALGYSVVFLRSALPRRIFILGLAAVVVVAFIADAVVLAGLYQRMHYLASYGYISVAAVGIWAMLPARVPKKLIVAIVGVALLLLGAGLADLSGGRSLATNAGVLEPKLKRLLRSCVDLDRDDFSPLFGGNDCDDFDSNVKPGAFEIPSNGKDDNCNGLVDPPAYTAAEAREIVPVPVADKSDVYILLADALRWELGGLRYSDFSFLERLRKESLFFDNAYTPYPSTFRAVISMLQSRYWRCVRKKDPNFFRLARLAGYDVQVWIDNKRLVEKSEGPSLVDANRRRGDPFSVSSTDGKESWTSTIVGQAINEIHEEQKGPPRLRWLHFYDTHSPILRRSSGQSNLEGYRNEAAHLLGALDRLLDALNSNDRGRRSVIVFLADHGEEFGEHGSDYHASNLWEQSIHVPLIVRLPGVEPRRISEPASLIDIVPTVASRMGLTEELSWQGRDWSASDRIDGPRLVVSQTEEIENWGGLGLPEKVSIRKRNFKGIFNLTDNDVQIFDLADDPDETVSIHAERPDLVNEMKILLAKWQDRSDCAPTP